MQLTANVGSSSLLLSLMLISLPFYRPSSMLRVSRQWLRCGTSALSVINKLQECLCSASIHQRSYERSDWFFRPPRCGPGQTVPPLWWWIKNHTPGSVKLFTRTVRAGRENRGELCLLTRANICVYFRFEQVLAVVKEVNGLHAWK